jgi:hypothetical protein
MVEEVEAAMQQVKAAFRRLSHDQLRVEWEAKREHVFDRSHRARAG